ncbi:MAG: DASS family sodium-coupled anion symporter [Ignavibacteriales bacterium]|nr:DASS family sodium-coupled anion symporter [Ignavibacteriales bacterium]
MPHLSAKLLGFGLGLVAFFLIIALPTFPQFLSAAEHFVQENQAHVAAANLARSMQAVLALLLLMVAWWITEAVPLSATALLPAVVLPLFQVNGLHGKELAEFTARNTLAHYANPVIYLFLGGFLLAAAMQKWRLDRRLTLWILTRGSLARNPRSILLSMMAVTAFLSMWISNTATTAMMLPLGLGVLTSMGLKPGESSYGTCLMLGIAWAASIGGVGTIIGTPPNGIALGILNATFAEDPGVHRITFLDWMSFGVPYVVLFVPVAWFVLLKTNPPEIGGLPNAREHFHLERIGLGRFSTGEKGTISMFLLAVTLWISNPFWNTFLPQNVASRLSWIDEYGIGLGVGVLLFFIPVNLKKHKFLLDWKDTSFVDWGTLILFGGGIALSDAMFKTGLGWWIATSFVGLFGNPSTIVMMLVIVVFVDFLTEVTSNTAVTSMIVPIVISIALKTGENPVALAVAAAVGASMAFMLPVATPPNALVYATGYVRIKDMVRSGFVLDIVGWGMTVLTIVVFADWIFGVIEF